MSRQLIFWAIMLVWVLFGFARYHGTSIYYGYGFDLVNFVLLALLGWKVYGPAIKE